VHERTVSGYGMMTVEWTSGLEDMHEGRNIVAVLPIASPSLDTDD
jgi:hypothetical protein